MALSYHTPALSRKPKSGPWKCCQCGNVASTNVANWVLKLGIGNILTLATFTSSRHLGGALGCQRKRIVMPLGVAVAYTTRPAAVAFVATSILYLLPNAGATI